MKYATFNPNGTIAVACNDDTVTELPSGALELSDAQFLTWPNYRRSEDGLSLIEVGPTVRTLAESKERVLNEARELRSKLFTVVDGMHSTALTKAIVSGDAADAVAINTFKEGMKAITSIDLSAATTEKAMRDAILNQYKALAAQAPMSVQIEFLKYVK